ncbi:SDR family NAD(P)-dependent oxidoreductase [Candidatus Kaistella beijingensis]|uniref:SDR family NAD(P)-dependent oxidoreductase n=1 Tax=Candidatus Kaistella beijingensis TaxID=2820270 RepID=UPI001CC52321|nr:SDR family NAD(P)-dependent oxidoreductase [Candidatus Kaistella beijingensis]UBB88681.1 SDR family NAD(P)-dependent oxidoreductase [Candidatus Kaistella beijingensis]
MNSEKNVLILGANSDVAKECAKLYLNKSFKVIMASRNLDEMKNFINENHLNSDKIELKYFDAVDFTSHQKFYDELHSKPNIVLYSAGFLVQNYEAFQDFEKTLTMMHTNYCCAVSVLNIIAMDKSNKNLERIIGLSSLSGVRGRKSNFVYGSTKSAFTQYLAGLRQELSSRKIQVNVFVLGYIRSKINEGLQLNQSLIMEPDYVAEKIVNVGNSFINVPNFKWKLIYQLLKNMPESLVARLP